MKKYGGIAVLVCIALAFIISGLVGFPNRSREWIDHEDHLYQALQNFKVSRSLGVEHFILRDTKIQCFYKDDPQITSEWRIAKKPEDDFRDFHYLDLVHLIKASDNAGPSTEEYAYQWNSNGVEFRLGIDTLSVDKIQYRIKSVWKGKDKITVYRYRPDS